MSSTQETRAPSNDGPGAGAECPPDRWSSGSVNVRLSKSRMARLRALATEAGRLLSPAEAIDRAIELAGTDPRSSHAAAQSQASELAELRLGMAALFREGRERSIEQGQQLERISADVARLAALIAAASSDDDAMGEGCDGFGVVSGGGAPALLRDWLDAQPVSGSGGHVRALATWLACRHDGTGRNVVEFHVQRSGAGQRHDAILFGPLSDEHPLARPRGQALALIAQRGERGWVVGFREIGSDGKLGTVIATMPV